MPKIAMSDVASPALHSPLGLIAGNGNLPIEVAKAARAQGLAVVTAAHCEGLPELEAHSTHITWLKIGQLGKAIRFLERHGAREVVLAGGVARVSLFSRFRCDWRAVRVLARARSLKDDALLRAVADEIELSGLRVVSAALLLERFLPSEGLLTSKDLTTSQKRDALIGWDAAKALGAVDVGQTVVVADGTVVAVEAVEGTDAAIRRAGELTSVKGKRRASVVVKVFKPVQDERVDLPTVGEKTLWSMKEAGADALVLEAKKSLIVDPERVVVLANSLGIAIRAVASREALLI